MGVIQAAQTTRSVGIAATAHGATMGQLFRGLKVPKGMAAMRRSTRSAAAGTVCRLGRLELNRTARWARIDGQALRLRAKEFDLLAALVEHAGIVLGRGQLLLMAWGYGVPVVTRTIDVHVHHLRMKLKGSGLCIETLRGAGYRLVQRSDEPISGQRGAAEPGAFPT
jgi:DNA-binding winged helix-turn-helix (wHTH) protein